jgi:raffinose/stachyose/melibiose transport system permease protein
MCISCFLVLVPILFLVFTSVKSPKDFYGKNVFMLPESIAWTNFTEALIRGKLSRYMFNGLLISVIKVPLGIFIEALAAFAITRLRIWRPNVIFIIFLIGMMIPMQVTLVPLNIGFRTLGLSNTYVGLIVVYLAFGIPFGILVMRGFFRTIPREIDESARIDGCPNFDLFLRIILPISKSAVSTLIILDFLATWNEFLLVSVLITDDRMRTVSAGLLSFMGEHGINYGLLTAGVLISILPVLIVYICFQRYFVEGMSGAIKG